MWQSRVYTFLFRRILGPFLTPQSQKSLHKSLSVSLRAGNFELLNVEFDGKAIASKLNLGNDVWIEKIHVKRMAVSLSLLYFNESGEVVENYEDGSARLTASVSLDGVDVQIRPSGVNSSNSHGPNDCHQADEKVKVQVNSSKSTSDDAKNSSSSVGKMSTIRSYVQAAIETLKLSLDINDISIRIASHDNAWVSLNVATVSYRDEKDRCTYTTYEQNQNPMPMHQPTKILKKELNIDTITLTVGEHTHTERGEYSEEVVRSEGVSVVRITDEFNGKVGIGRYLELIIEPELVLNASVDTLQRIYRVAMDMTRTYTSKSTSELERTRNGLRLEENDAQGERMVEDGSGHSSERDFDDTGRDYSNGLLANIIQKQGDEHYMDNLSKKKSQVVNNRVLSMNEEGDLNTVNDLGIERNMAQSSGQDTDDLEPDLDDFFDSNDEDISHYRSALEASITSDGNTTNVTSTSLHVNVRKVSMHLHLYDGVSPSVTNDQTPDDTVVLTMECFDLSSTRKNSKQSIAMELSVFRIDHMAPNTDEDESYLSSSLFDLFGDCQENHDSGEAAISPGPVLSVTFDKAEDGQSNPSEIGISISVNPLQLTFRHLIISKIVKSLGGILGRGPSKDSSDVESITNTPSSNINCSLTCGIFLVLVPLESENHGAPEASLDNIFERSGYKADSVQGLNAPTLSWEATQFSLRVTQAASQGEAEDLQITACFQRSVVSFILPMNDEFEVEFNNTVRRLDLLAFESEEKIDPDAVIKAEVVSSCLVNKNETDKKKRAKIYFPLVTPLASVKASQQYDGNDLGAHDAFGVNASSKPGKKRPRGSDPQIAMLKSINDCEKIIRIHIPSVAVDLSILEIDSLLSVLQSVSIPATSSSIDDNDEIDNLNPFCVNFQCDQCTISIHQEYNTSEASLGENQDFNHMLVFDGFKSHFFVEKNTRKHMRILADDVTLYESEEEGSPISVRSKPIRTLEEMCEQIRKRRANRNVTTSAKFFRSKMSNPLSPKTPAILIDVIIRRDEYHTEKALHISIYDMTYRYQYQSAWIERIINIFNRRKQNEHIPEEKDDDSSEETINNLFITLSDCNLDYTAPKTFNTECRTIIHVGEIRMTSNIVLPSGPVRVIKMTLADASIHIANRRVGHDLENAKLSCAKPVMNIIDQDISHAESFLISHSFDDALSRMDFVRVVTLDCLDSTASLTSATSDTTNDADCSITLSIGRTCIYACKDSFLCFTESTNELINNLTMPSISELEIMRKDFLSKQAQSYQSGTNERIVQEEGASITNQDSDSIKTTASLVEVIDHDLFTDSILEEDGEEPTNERDVIDDFFTVGRRQAKASRSYCTSSEEQPAANIDSWTAVHHAWDNDESIAEGEEQSTRWYTEEELKGGIGPNMSTSPSNLLLPCHTKVIIDGGIGERRPHVFPRHIPINPVTNPLDPALNDMGAAKYAGTEISPKVKLRIMIEDMSVHFRFFDGNDWDHTESNETTEANTTSLMNALVSGEDKSTALFAKAEKRHTNQARRSQRYFQFSFTGLKLRMDSFEDSPNHSLSSCLDLTLADLFFLETISADTPVKLLGEWRSDDHLRDSNDGLMMMKMVSLHPDEKFSSDGKLMGDEGRVTMEFLPLRFFIHQVALRFIRSFFRNEKEAITPESSIASPPEMFFPVFQVKPFNIKVDYKPTHVNTSALKDGSLVELLNVLPLEEMILRLSEVEMRNLTGWGSIISELACNWLQDVSSTQMHKFLTRTTPLHPFATVGDGMKQFLMIPLEEYQQKGDVKKGLRKGTKKLASVLAYETVSVGAKVSGFVAKKLGKKKSKTRVEADHQLLSYHGSTLPRSMNEVSDHAIESLTRGLKEANAKMIIIPYRQYQESGTRGAMKSVVRGLPVAVCAPLSGAAEAVSYSLYGVRNQLRPDLREEEEASNRLHEFHF